MNAALYWKRAPLTDRQTDSDFCSPAAAWHACPGHSGSHVPRSNARQYYQTVAAAPLHQLCVCMYRRIRCVRPCCTGTSLRMCPWCGPRCMGLSRSDAVLVFCCLEGGECDLGIGEVVQGAENGCHARRIGLRRRSKSKLNNITKCLVIQ